MKKIIAALVCFALIAALLCGCSININGESGFSLNGISNYRYDNASEYTASSDFSIDTAVQTITEIDLSWVAGEVTVKITDSDKLRVSETGAETDDDIMRYRVSGSTLDIKWRANGSYKELKKSVVMEIPKALAGAVELDAELVSASIEVGGLNFTELSAQSVSGDIKVSDCTAKEISVQTVSGDSTVSGCKADEFSANSTSGEVDAEGDFADIDIETVSGGAKLKYTGTLKELDAQTVSGDVKILGSCKPSKISVGTVSGDITFCGEDKDGRSFDERVDGGTGEIDIETVSGDIDFDVSQ